MDSSRLRFPRLNLARTGATYLAIFGSYELNEGRLALLPERRNRSPEGHTETAALNFTRYTSRGVASASYTIAATSHSNDDSNEIHVVIHYRKTAEGARPRRVVGVPEGRFLEIAQSMGVPNEVSGLVLFQFDGREPNQLWFPLPVSLAGQSPEDIIEVRGVRGAKLGPHGAGPEYEFILDRPADDKVALQINMDMEGPITAESPLLLFNRAKSIARDLVSDS